MCARAQYSIVEPIVHGREIKTVGLELTTDQPVALLELVGREGEDNAEDV